MTGEQQIKNRRCEITGKTFDLTDAEIAHHEMMGDLDGLIPLRLPYPRIHPLETLRQIFSYSHLTSLYRATSTHSGKPQITRYRPALGYKICTLEEFNSGSIDNIDAARAYDFTRPFFQQFDELMHSALQPPLNSTNTEDSDFVNGALNVRGCYLSFNIMESQDCLYCISSYNGHDNLFCVQTNRCQYCYGCVNVDGCYECQHCLFSNNCSGCFGCYDCIGCSDCIGCVGLRNARHQIYNVQHSPEEFAKRRRDFNLNSHAKHERLLKECREFVASQNPRREFLVNTEDSTGNYLRSCRNLHQCWLGANCEDCGYLFPLIDSHDCWYGWAMNSELTYHSGSMKSRHVAYSYSTLECESCIYCYHCYNRCAFCIGCVGLRGKSFCILNKQYSKKEFFELAPRVVAHMQSTGEWGLFLPPGISPYPYQESGAPDFIEPLPDDELKRRGYRVLDLADPAPTGNAVPASELPDDIKTVDIDSWAGRAVKCSETGQVFNLQKKELAAYKRLDLPLPRVHWKRALTSLQRLREPVPAIY